MKPELIIKHQQTRKFFECIFLLDLILLALIRWIPGSDPLQPESGIRGYLEVGILALAMLFIWYRWGFKTLLDNFKSTYVLVITAFCLWAMVTAFWAPSFIVAFGKAGSLFAVVMITGAIAQQVHQYRLSVTKIMLLGTILFMIFLLGISLISEGVPLQRISQGGRERLVLGYSHPNETSNFFIILISCGFVFMLEKKSLKETVFILFILLFSMIGLYLTKSRASISGIILTIGLYYLLTLKNAKLKILIISFLGLVCVGVLFILIAGDIDFDQKIFTFRNYSFDFFTLAGRFRIWKKLFRSIEGLNLFGLGYSAPRYILTKYNSWAFSAHNSFIEVFISTGFIGIFFLLIFHLLFFRFFLQIQRYPLQFVFFMFITILGVVESKLFVPKMIMAFLTLVLLTGEISILKENDDPQQT